MAEFKEQAHFKDIPKRVIIHAIESISAGLIQDAKYNFGGEYGFESRLEVKENPGLVECEVKFFPYDYKFRWLVAPEEGGYLVTFVGTTPGGILDLIWGMKKKLRGLMDTQWAALINFGVGFVSAKYYSRDLKAPGKTPPPREHIKMAKRVVRTRPKEEHKKTPIDVTKGK